MRKKIHNAHIEILKKSTIKISKKSGAFLWFFIIKKSTKNIPYKMPRNKHFLGNSYA